MSSLKKYRKIKYLGKGSYGAAILVELRSDPSKKFVIKEIVIGHLKPAEQQSAKNEAEVLHQMNHSNITMYIESFVENSKLYIVMEHADGGDLSGAIQKRKADGKYWAEEELMRIFVQICLAMKHVHDQNILHRDLKSQNIFLTQKGMVKLGDFGIAKVLDTSEDQARTQIGTPYYLSPEICESQPYGRKSDVWSLGVVLYELLALEMPFQANSLPALVHKIVSAEPNYSIVETRYSAKLISLCRDLLSKNSDARPTVTQVVKNDYIKDHISKLLSYTLKSGTGGVEGAIIPRPTSSEMRRFDAEEVDRRIELAREKEREQLRGQGPGIAGARDPQESKESGSAYDRGAQAKKEDEKEKLRKFREDMLRRKREEAKELSRGGADRSRSPKDRNGRAAPTSSDRSRSPVNRGQPDRSRSPKDRARSNSQNNNNGVVAVAPRVNPYQRNANAGGRSPVNPIARGRSLAEIQAQRQQDIYREQQQQSQQQRSGYMVAAQPPSSAAGANGNDAHSYESAARREYFASRAAAQAYKAKVEAMERAERGGGSGNGGSSSNLLGAPSQPQLLQQQQQRRPSGGIDYSDMDPEQRIAMIKAQREREKQQEIALKEQQMKAAIEQHREERRRFSQQQQQQFGHEDPRDVDPYAAAGGAAGGAGGRRSKGAIAFDIDLKSDDISSVRSSNNHQKVQSRWSIERDAQRKPSAGDANVGNSANVQAAPAIVAPSKTPTGGASSSGSNGSSRRGWGPPVEAKDLYQGRGQVSPAVVEMEEDLVATSETAIRGYQQQLQQQQQQRNRSNSNASASTADANGHGDGNTGDDYVVLQRLESKRQSDMAMREQALEVMAKLREKKLKEAQMKKEKRKASLLGSAAGPRTDAKPVTHVHNVVSPVKRNVPSTAEDAKSHGRPHSPKLMEVLQSIEAARDVVENVVIGSRDHPGQIRSARPAPVHASAAAGSVDVVNQRSQVNGVSPARRRPSQTQAADAKQSGSNQGTPGRGGRVSAEEVREVRNLDRISDDKYTAEEAAADRRLLAEDEGRDEEGEEDNDDDLDSSLAKWLQQQKRGVTIRKKPASFTAAACKDDDHNQQHRTTTSNANAVSGERTRRSDGTYQTYMSVDALAETVDEEDNVNFYASQQRTQTNIRSHDSNGAAPLEDYYDDEYFEDGGEATLVRGSLASNKARVVHRDVDDEDGALDMQRPLRAKFANGEDAEVIGMQCMLAQALIDEDDTNVASY